VFALSPGRTGYMSGETGIANSTITALLQGGRAMTRRHIETFARYFRTPLALFLPGNGCGTAAPPGCRQTPDWRTGDPCPGPGRLATIEKANPVHWTRITVAEDRSDSLVVKS
jgi:hypothetical protein